MTKENATGDNFNFIASKVDEVREKAVPIRSQNSKTLMEILKLSTQYLQQKGSQSPRLDAELLLRSVLSIDRIKLYSQFDRPITEDELVSLRQLLSRRGKHEPVAYILNQREFYGYPLYVDKSVLIPRPDTEKLVDLFVESVENSPLSWRQGSYLEIGTGSACISIAIFQELGIPALATLSDISSVALEVAKRNLETYNLFEKRVRLIKSDLLENFNNESYGFIVSNPPYVGLDEYKQLSPDIREFEPKQALVGGDYGYELIQQLLSQTYRCLKPEGIIALEIGCNQKKIISDIALDIGYKNIQVYKDDGNHDRVLIMNK